MQVDPKRPEQGAGGSIAELSDHMRLTLTNQVCCYEDRLVKVTDTGMLLPVRQEYIKCLVRKEIPTMPECKVVLVARDIKRNRDRLQRIDRTMVQLKCGNGTTRKWWYLMSLNDQHELDRHRNMMAFYIPCSNIHNDPKCIKCFHK